MVPCGGSTTVVPVTVETFHWDLLGLDMRGVRGPDARVTWTFVIIATGISVVVLAIGQLVFRRSTADLRRRTA